MPSPPPPPVSEYYFIEPHLLSDDNLGLHMICSVAMMGLIIRSLCSICEYGYVTICTAWRTWAKVGLTGIYRFAVYYSA